MGVFSHAERKCGIFEVERVDYGCVSAIITAEAKGGSGIAQTTNDGERMMNVNDVTFNDGETKMNEQTEQTEQAEQTEQTEQAQIVDKPHAIAPQPSKSTKTTWKMVYLDSEGNVLKETPRGRGRPPYAAEADEVNKTITIPNCHVNASGEIVTPKAPRPTGNTGNTGSTTAKPVYYLILDSDAHEVKRIRKGRGAPKAIASPSEDGSGNYIIRTDDLLAEALDSLEGKSKGKAQPKPDTEASEASEAVEPEHVEPQQTVDEIDETVDEVDETVDEVDETVDEVDEDESVSDMIEADMEETIEI